MRVVEIDLEKTAALLKSRKNTAATGGVRPPATPHVRGSVCDRVEDYRFGYEVLDCAMVVVPTVEKRHHLRLLLYEAP